MKNIALLLSLILFAQCSIDRTMKKVSQMGKTKLEVFQQLDDPHQLAICGKEEPGERLLLALTFVDKTNQQALAGQEVNFYHTSIAGEYQQEDPNDESTARLNGMARTDGQGRILVSTILPGDYGNSSDIRHIHTTVFGAHPEAYDIHFRQYTGYMGRNFVEGSDQHFLAELKSLEDDLLLCFLTIEVKNPTNQ